jgi:hypothetical protein
MTVPATDEKIADDAAFWESAAKGPRLLLAPVESAAASRLIKGDSSRVVLLTERRAAAFAGEKSGESRKRSLARALAIAETLLHQYSAVQEQVTRTNNINNAVAFGKIVSGATDRYVKLVDALRTEEQGGKRSVVVVGRADAVNVSSKE